MYVCVSKCVYKTGDRQREREGTISPRQLFFIVLLHARSIFLVSGDSRGFHQDFSHISEFGKAVSPACVPPPFQASPSSSHSQLPFSQLM